jgi:hypothetical protein
MDGLIVSVPLKDKHTRTFVVGGIILHDDRFGESGQDVIDEKIIVCQLYAACETRAMRDERERRDERDGGEFEVRSSRFSELRTSSRAFLARPACLALHAPRSSDRLLAKQIDEFAR